MRIVDLYDLKYKYFAEKGKPAGKNVFPPTEAQSTASKILWLKVLVLLGSGATFAEKCDATAKCFSTDRSTKHGFKISNLRILRYC